MVGNISTMLMYTYNTKLFCNVNTKVKNDLLNCELSKVCDWLGANKLAVNVSKIEYMFFPNANKNFTYLKQTLMELILNESQILTI